MPREQISSLARDSSGKFKKVVDSVQSCRFCGSVNVARFGYNLTKSGKQQRYKCNDCNSKFTPTSKLIKPIKFNAHKDIEARKDEQLNVFCKQVRKDIFKEIAFKLHYTAKYSPSKFLDVLTHVAMHNDFTHNGAETFKKTQKYGPTSTDLLYHVRKMKIQDIKDAFKQAFEKSFKIARQSNLFYKRFLDVAIDLHEWMYYGDKNDPMVVGTKEKNGTNYCYRFATINIVERGMRFTLLALPMSQLDEKHKVIQELIDYAKKHIRIGTIYADRGFFSIQCINTLDQCGYYLMPAVRDPKIKRMLETHSAPDVIDYTMGRKRPSSPNAHFKLAICEEDGEKYGFATNLNVKPQHANNLFLLYDKRWGIETSYRVKQDFKARTTSKRYVVRLFYFLFSACLYNLWVLASVVIGKAILLFFPKKPIVTAKMFGLTLYTVEPGGE